MLFVWPLDWRHRGGGVFFQARWSTGTASGPIVELVHYIWKFIVIRTWVIHILDKLFSFLFPTSKGHVTDSADIPHVFLQTRKVKNFWVDTFCFFRKSPKETVPSAKLNLNYFRGLKFLVKQPPVSRAMWRWIQAKSSSRPNSFQSQPSHRCMCHMEPVLFLSFPFDKGIKPCKTQIQAAKSTYNLIQGDTHTLYGNVCCRIWFNHQSFVVNEWYILTWVNGDPWKW